MGISILVKPNFQYLDILITFDFKIYYLKIEPLNNIWILHQLCLLEEIPDKKEFNERICYYVNHEFYKKLNEKLSLGYLINIQKWLDIYRNFIKVENFRLFYELYEGSQFHPDAIDLIHVMPSLIKKLRSSLRKTNNEQR